MIETEKAIRQRREYALPVAPTEDSMARHSQLASVPLDALRRIVLTQIKEAMDMYRKSFKG